MHRQIIMLPDRHAAGDSKRGTAGEAADILDFFDPEQYHEETMARSVCIRQCSVKAPANF